MPWDDRKNTESIIRSTVERSHEARDLTETEINHAVKVGMELTDKPGGSGMNWGQIAEAGLASVRAKRNTP